MGGDGVSDVSAGAGEGVRGMVNGRGLTSRSTAWSRACGGGINPQIPPSFQQHLKFWLSLFYSTAEEGHSDLAKSVPF